MRPKTLLWTIVVVGSFVWVVYFWAWPKLQGPVSQSKDRLPPKVEIQMPNPGG